MSRLRARTTPRLHLQGSPLLPLLRGIFRKRRKTLTILFHTAVESLQDAFRTRLNLPQGRIGAIAALHTFGDYLIFHPHLHLLAADGLFTPDGRFHCMPAEDLAPTIELFRHRFLHALRDAKLISPQKLASLLSWKHSGFSIHHGGKEFVPAHDAAGRKRLAEPERSGVRAPGGWPREG